MLVFENEIMVLVTDPKANHFDEINNFNLSV